MGDEKVEIDGDHFEKSVLSNFSAEDKEFLRKYWKKISNEGLDTYERWKSMVILEKVAGNLGIFSQSKIDSINIDANKNFITLDGICSAMFLMGKRYKINKKTLNLLDNTSSKIEYINLPSHFIFLELVEPLKIISDKDGVELFGFILSPGFNKDYEKVIRISIFGRDTNDGNCFYQTNNISSDGLESVDPYKFEGLGKEIENRIPNIVCNFLNLINHPEVEIINHSNKLLHSAQIKKGKLGIPDNVEINLTGKLKRYINETSQNNEKAWELGHRFWVRGHWMEFKHPRYKNKQGEKTWVLPYIKGKGELVKKDYYIGEKEQCWAHEAEMIKVVRELYSEYEVQTHNRTILEGLEIDCYIPELKLGFEYNGLQHYEHVQIFHKTIEDFEKQKDRDIEKMKRAKKKDIKIIIIRYDESVTEEVIKCKTLTT